MKKLMEDIKSTRSSSSSNSSLNERTKERTAGYRTYANGGSSYRASSPNPNPRIYPAHNNSNNNNNTSSNSNSSFSNNNNNRSNSNNNSYSNAFKSSSDSNSSSNNSSSFNNNKYGSSVKPENRNSGININRVSALSSLDDLRKFYAAKDNSVQIIRRGDIFYADLNQTTGSEQGGMRPVLIVQNNKGNMHSPTVIAAAITSQNKRALPTHIEISNEGFGLTKCSTIMLEQIRTIDKTRLRDKIGHLDDETMIKVNDALFISFGISIDLLSKSVIQSSSENYESEFGNTSDVDVEDDDVDDEEVEEFNTVDTVEEVDEIETTEETEDTEDIEIGIEAESLRRAGRSLRKHKSEAARRQLVKYY